MPDRVAPGDLRLPLGAFLLALAGRAILLWQVPHAYAFDAFQRWSGRHELLVRDWLPATQAVVTAVAAAGGDHLAARAALAVVASVGVAGGAVVARHLAGRESAGWLFVPVGLFGPYLCWSTALYQEGTFLALMLAGLGLALSARGPGLRLLADVVVGALGLVRYEGWPFVLLYLLWRRDPRAAVALWGPALWLSLKAAGVDGVHPSPVDYADWNGLTDRTTLSTWLADAGRLLSQSVDSGGVVLALGGLAGMAWALVRRRPAAGLLALAVGAQAAATVGWIAGLETAIVRMQVVPGVLLGIFAAAGAAVLAARWGRRGLLVAGMVAVVTGGLFLRDGVALAERSARGYRVERAMIADVEEARAACPDCAVVLHPRTGLGSRDRHDGCEIAEGIAGWDHPADFTCATWLATGAEDGAEDGAEEEAEVLPRIEARWQGRKRGYEVTIRRAP